MKEFVENNLLFLLLELIKTEVNLKEIFWEYAIIKYVLLFKNQSTTIIFVMRFFKCNISYFFLPSFSDGARYISPKPSSLRITEKISNRYSLHLAFKLRGAKTRGRLRIFTPVFPGKSEFTS